MKIKKRKQPLTKAQDTLLKESIRTLLGPGLLSSSLLENHLAARKESKREAFLREAFSYTLFHSER